MIGTLDLERSCLQTSVPDNPGNIRSNKTKSAPFLSNAVMAPSPVSATITSKPSLPNTYASASENEASSSTTNILVIYYLPSGVD